ncbi:MAG TPA: hypothetical protein VHC90_05245 [Bryobacteraceae bacterium]|nr:hypothetical protein [Bryobacteraceae bacterium]
MHFNQSPDLLLILQAAAAAFAAARLLQLRLIRRFLYVFSYLAATAVFDIGFSILDRHSQAYYWTYAIADPTIWLTASLAVYQMFSLIFRDYPGLTTAGRWALNGALALSLIAATVILRTPWSFLSTRSTALYYELVLDRSIHFGLAAIVLVLMLFLSRYPLHLERNTYVASGFFSVVFLAESVTRFIDGFTPALFSHQVDNPEIVFVTLAFAGWGILLRTAAAVPVPVRGTANTVREAELLRQLDALNGILTRSVRR